MCFPYVIFNIKNNIIIVLKKQNGFERSTFTLENKIFLTTGNDLNKFWFIDPITNIIGRFSSWLESIIFTFGNVSRDTSLIIGQSGLIFFHYI